MTLDKFFEVLGTIDGWYLRTVTSHIRRHERDKLACPVCAVCNRILGTLYTEEWEKAATKLDLDTVTAYKIVLGADDTSRVFDGNGYRSKLLEICKLKETT